MTKDEIKKLAERVVSGIATNEEIHLYSQLYESFQSSENEWKDDVYGDREELEMIMREAIWKRTGIEKLVIRMKWIRWAAAAVLISAVSFLILRDRGPKIPIAGQETQQVRFKNDVAPGQEGAILTLSNGKTIVLDNANNGSLAQEGATEVIKKDGQVVYANQGGPSEVVYNTMSTPKGRLYNLVLADGSKVWLNAASSITFPTAFTGKERKVSITGEAYFEIAHISSPVGGGREGAMPFIVQKGEMSVQVLGTHFNINSYEDEEAIKVTLLEGSVKVTKGNANSLIKPGQQARLQDDGIKLVNDANINSIMAWKNGLFDFERIDIGSLMRQLSRWYDVEVVYDKKIDELFYAKIPRNTNLSDVLKILELTGKVRFEINGKKITVTP